MTIYNFIVQDLQHKEFDFSQLKGKVIVIVNVASKCGFTKQYEGLQKLYNDYKSAGLEIVGFPCNQFMHQEPGDEATITTCGLKYGVSFPIMSKVDVNGKEVAPIYDFLKKEQGGKLGDAIKWNFTKFLVNKEGQVVQRFAPTTEPADMEKEIKACLGL